MFSFRKTAGLLTGLLAVASAFPTMPRFTADQMKLYELSKRQANAAAAAGLTDIDILQFALTLEWLEATFYQQGFAKFPASDFAALGLSQKTIDDLVGIGKTEFTHVSLLQGAIAQAGVQPVQPCTYNFGFTDAAGMVATAAILESVGVSAYLGAGPLVQDKGILGTAASILTVEARHQTFVRVASSVAASPAAFDTALSPKQVFSLAAPFIQSCPQGSNLLALTAFPTLAMAGGVAATAAIGATIQLQSDSAGQATFCAFTNGNVLGGTLFSAFTQGTGCVVPGQDLLAGVVYVNLVTAAPANGVITDDIIVAGPMVMQIS